MSEIFGEKVTPLHDTSWYTKWAATILVLIGLAVRASGYNTTLDLMLSFHGTIGWVIVGFMWQDRALIILNGVASCLILITLIKHLSV